MSNQKKRETGSSDVSAATSSSSSATPQEPQRPVVIARPVSGSSSSGAAGKTSKTASRKPSSKKSANKKIRKRTTSGSGASSDSKSNRQPARKPRFSRKQIILLLIALVVIFDVVILTIGYLSNKNSVKTPANTDPIALIQSQMSNNKTIAEIGHDSALIFANYPDLTIANAASLKPIENNLLKSGGGPDGKDSLYDEQIVGRVLKFNSDWVDYLNKSSQTVFESVQENSPAQTKIAELGAGSLVAYHRLAIGEIRHTGKNYYLITRASYTLTKDGQLDIHDDIFVYKLVAQGTTMLIVDFEQIPVNAGPEPALDEQPTGSDSAEPGATEPGATDESAGQGAEEGTEESAPEPEA